MTGFDFSWSSGYYSDGCSAKAFANAFGGNGLLLKDAYTAFDVNPDCGMRGTEFGSNADSTIGHFAAEGLNIGVSTSGEHLTVGSLKFIYMLSYYNRTIEPLLDAVSEEFQRKFLTKTARTQRQAMDYWRDPFKLVPLEKLGEISNNLSRNEIAAANELRPYFGFGRHSDPKADQLNNSNINPNQPAPSGLANQIDQLNQEGDPQNGS